MTTREGAARELDALFSICFAGGQIRQRELRLSPAERAYLQAQFPQATLTPVGVHTAEKSWFQVSLGDAFV